MKIQELYNKVKEFEASIAASNLEKSQCRAGCSRCCYTDISIFSVEADHIRSWFEGLPLEQQNGLRMLWEKPLQERESFQGDIVSSCSFLAGEKCTIYEARPLICRTQGLAFTFKDKRETFVDICPLNEGMLETLGPKEFLNLDLLNSILASLERLKSPSASRVSLRVLRDELKTV